MYVCMQSVERSFSLSLSLNTFVIRRRVSRLGHRWEIKESLPTSLSPVESSCGNGIVFARNRNGRHRFKMRRCNVQCQIVTFLAWYTRKFTRSYKISNYLTVIICVRILKELKFATHVIVTRIFSRHDSCNSNNGLSLKSQSKKLLQRRKWQCPARTYGSQRVNWA